MRLADAFEAFLVDLDGVVWRGDEEVPGAAETVAVLRAEGKRVVFVTNNASRSPRECAAKLMRMRIPTDPTDVVTSAHAVDRHLRAIGLRPGSLIHVCAAEGLQRVLRSHGYVPTRETDGVEALVVAWDPGLVYDDLRRAADVARSGVPFVAANRDATYPTADGETPGTGSILAAIETASGREATVVGKPRPELFVHALRVAGSAPERTLVVGDRAETDVAGARAAGLDAALVLTGVVRDAEGVSPAPDWVLERMADLLTDGAASPRSVGVAAVAADPPRTSDDEDEDDAGDEPADVREVRDAAAITGLPETREATEDLDDEPDPEHDPGRRAHGREEEPQWDERDDGGAWPQDDVGTEDAGDGAGRADDGDERRWVDDDVGESGSETGHDVEHDVANVPQTIFDVVPEDPQEEHVEAEMQDVGVHEHRRD